MPVEKRRRKQEKHARKRQGRKEGKEGRADHPQPHSPSPPPLPLPALCSTPPSDALLISSVTFVTVTADHASELFNSSARSSVSLSCSMEEWKA
eukprot:1047014-Rhodomonas_salina.1